MTELATSARDLSDPEARADALHELDRVLTAEAAAVWLGRWGEALRPWLADFEGRIAAEVYERLEDLEA